VYYDAPDMTRRKSQAEVEQLSAFENLEPAPRTEPEPGADTMRHIVSLRMPDALLERVEAVARDRGVSPSSLMRALIAAGLDRSYAAVAEGDLARELSALRRRVEQLASLLEERRTSE
jgi:prolyl-tRNA editing enzyme YbaK/EbsC (Cys-tRNA(Pro) deacylase)